MKFISQDVVKSVIIFTLIFFPVTVLFGFFWGLSGAFTLVDGLITGVICLFAGFFIVGIFHAKNEYRSALLTGFLLLNIVALLIWFGVLYSKHGIVDASGALINDFWTCFYFSVVTFTTLGFGDFTPSEGVRMVAAFEALIGYSYLGLLIATFIVVMRKQVERKHKQQ